MELEYSKRLPGVRLYGETRRRYEEIRAKREREFLAQGCATDERRVFSTERDAVKETNKSK